MIYQVSLSKLEFGFLNVQALIELGVESPKGIGHMSSWFSRLQYIKHIFPLSNISDTYQIQWGRITRLLILTAPTC